MLKKTIKYTDYNGVEREEEFYFNLSKAELVELDLRQAGGFEAYVKRLTKTEDRDEIVDLFKKIVGMAYGEKSDDGRRFIKSKELTEAFEQTEAYSELFMELISSEEAAAQFINGVIPKADKAPDKPELPASSD